MKIDIAEQKILFDNFFQIEAARLRYEKFNDEMSDELTYTILILSATMGQPVSSIIQIRRRSCLSSNFAIRHTVSTMHG